MKPIPFEGQTTVAAKNQPQYNALPCHIDKSQEGKVTTCWHLTRLERIKLLLTGRIWLQMLMFRSDGQLNPITPVKMSVKRSDLIPEAPVADTERKQFIRDLESIRDAISAAEGLPEFKGHDLMVVVSDGMKKYIFSGFDKYPVPNYVRFDDVGNVKVFGVLLVNYYTATSFAFIPDGVRDDNEIFVTILPPKQ